MALAKLGFGTSQLMGRIGRKESLRLMDVAYDAGIRHFDTAPLYGLGAGEAMVGEFAASKREHITIATKFGIRPPARSPWMDFGKSSARIAVKLVPSLRATLRTRADSMVARGVFTAEECREGLRSSLQQLRTDYIDLFLMHEVLEQQINAELLQVLDEAVQKGFIRNYGIATSAAATVEICRTLRPGTVAQFASNVFEPIVGRIPTHLVRITHSALGAGFSSFSSQLIANSAARKRWSTALDFDCSNIDQLGRLFLYSAMAENAGGTVVFFSANEERIRQNAQLMSGSSFTGAQVEILSDLMTEEHRESLQAF
jgi:aryl-alcohol dehydrogenase-like predicted oxidoreductase